MNFGGNNIIRNGRVIVSNQKEESISIQTVKIKVKTNWLFKSRYIPIMQFLLFKVHPVLPYDITLKQTVLDNINLFGQINVESHQRF